MFYGFFKKFLAFSIFLLVIEGSVSAQQRALYQDVSVRFQNITVDSAFRILANKTHLDFTYNTSLIPHQKKVTATFDSIPLSIILDSLLKKPLVQYCIIDNQLVFYEKNDSTRYSAAKIQKARTIIGKIVDGANGRVLPYSSVSILNQNIGVISNEDGIFIFKIPTNYHMDTLVISHLGYYLYKIPIAGIKDTRVYKMNERSVSLPEILIRSIPASEVIRRAVVNIPNNYFRGPFLMRSFYREIVKRDKKYMSYTEAILDIYKRPMRPTLFRNEVKVVKERKFNNLKLQDTLNFKLKGGIDAILKLDVIRNPLEFLELHNKTYHYSLVNMQFVDGRLTFVIRFTPIDETEKPVFEGEMYIDAKSYAILQIRFGYSKKSLRKLRNVFVVKTSRYIKSYPTENQYIVSYKSFDGKYYIHHIVGTIGLKVKRKNKWLASHYLVTFEMIGTDIENKRPIRFVASEIIKPNKIFSDMISRGETRFWRNENIIPPETDVIKALKKFKKAELKKK
jgi:uncharacterized membrane protein required for colicin V production